MQSLGASQAGMGDVAAAAEAGSRGNKVLIVDKMPILGGNDVKLIAQTEDFIDELIADINAALHHVHLLFYIFADDGTGCRVADAVRMPQWKPGSEFKARRDESMAGRK